MKPATDITDFVAGSMALPPLVDRALPAPVEVEATATPSRLNDLYELTKPRMNFLVVVTTMVGYFMAVAHRAPMEWTRLLHAVIGTALTAAGASVLNQYVERGHDANMPRTAGRPVPAGRIKPLEALLLGVTFSVAGVLYLTFLVNPLTAALGVFTLASYVWVYTPMKRWSTLCTVVGAIPGAIPPVMGWTAVQNNLTPEAMVLFGILFLWQMPHFLAIAILYKDDYTAGGFKMLPCVDPGLHATSRQILVYMLSLIPVTLMPFGLRMAGTSYLIGAIALNAVFLWYAILCVKSKTRQDARKLFFVSIIYLPLLFAVLMLDKI